ncbi:unnamed protein product [Cunninghamella echinulata]
MYQESSYEVTTTSVSYSSEDGVVHSSTTHSSSQSQSQTLIVTAVGANTDKNKDLVSNQDPYLRVSINLEDKKSFQKTYTAKGAGKTPSWNQTFTLPLAGEPDLFVEILDEEATADGIIGFAAIPINQIVYAPGGGMNGIFDIYNVKSEVVGSVNLVLMTTGFETSSNQQPTQQVRGQSYVQEFHLKRCQSIRKKEHASEAGAALLGAAAAVGAGFLGKKLYDDHKKDEEEERLRKEEEERRRQELEQREQEASRRRQEDDQREQDLKRREEEFERRQREQEQEKARRCEDDDENKKKKKNDCDTDKKKKKKDECRRKGKGSGSDDSDSDSDDDKKSRRKKKGGDSSDDDSDDDKKCHRKKKGACDWDPVGTYAAGDRVEYKGRVYVCLQGHTSNPTWEPTVAHSLWRAE